LNIDEKPILTIYQDSLEEKLKREKDVLGIYLSMHPIEMIKERSHMSYVNVSSLYDWVGKNVNIIVQIQRVKNLTDRKGQEMCFIEGYDESGSVDGVVFGSRFKTVAIALKKGHICLIYGKVDLKDKLSIIVEKARMLE
jgi:DNA polymerase-3 subunit alpha